MRGRDLTSVSTFPFLEIDLPKRQPLFTALRSQPGQWDPVDEGPDPKVPGRCFVRGLPSGVDLGVRNTLCSWLTLLGREKGPLGEASLWP